MALRMHRFGDTTAVLAGMFVDALHGADQFAAIVATACWDSLRASAAALRRLTRVGRCGKKQLSR